MHTQFHSGNHKVTDRPPGIVFLIWCATTCIEMRFYTLNNSSQHVITAVKNYSALLCHLIGLCCCFFVKLLVFSIVHIYLHLLHTVVFSE